MKAEMTKEKIEILLKARKIVDAHMERRLSIETAKPTGKTSLSAYSAVNNSIVSYLSELEKLGIKGIADLKEFNEAMCLDLIRQERTITGKCDRCAGYKGTPPCVTWYGEGGCYYTGKPFDPEEQYKEILQRVRGRLKNPATTSKSVENRGNGCPPGNDRPSFKKGIALKDAPFDIMWEI